MNIFTSGYEFTTALTNMVLTIVAGLCCYKLNKRTVNWEWIMFFLLVTISGFFGILVHGINFRPGLIKTLWFILAFGFTLSINTLVYLIAFKDKYEYRQVIAASLLIYLIFFFEMLAGKDFLKTFIIYSAICLIFSIVMIIKKGIMSNKYLFAGLVLQVVGGLLLFINTKNNLIFGLNKNGLYHIFMIFTLIFFYLSAKRKKHFYR